MRYLGDSTFKTNAIIALDETLNIWDSCGNMVFFPFIF